MKWLVVGLNSLFLAGCSLFGVHSYQEAAYSVVEDHGRFQIRLFKPLVAAQTSVAADYEKAAGAAFERLFGYISGKNRTQRKIAMTAPVFTEQQGEKIAMTAPVFQERSGPNWVMQFVLPSDYSIETAPVPVDRSIEIKPLPAKKMAVLRYSGRLTADRIAEKSEELLAWLAENGYKPVSAARSAGFDPPWTLPFLRRNEVQIEVE